MKIPAVVAVFAFVAGSLVNGALGWLYGCEGSLGRSVVVALVASLLWAARGLPGAVFGGAYRYPLRDSRGRFVSRKTLRENHAQKVKVAQVLQPSPYSAPLDPFKAVS